MRQLINTIGATTSDRGERAAEFCAEGCIDRQISATDQACRHRADESACHRAAGNAQTGHAGTGNIGAAARAMLRSGARDG